MVGGWVGGKACMRWAGAASPAPLPSSSHRHLFLPCPPPSLAPTPRACDLPPAVLSGIAIGAGKQTRGFTINAAAHWGFGLPTALLLGFHFKLGVEGLYAGDCHGSGSHEQLRHKQLNGDASGGLG